MTGNAATETTATAAELVAEIRAAEQAATPGPWRWRGNTDNGDPYLAGGYPVDPQTGQRESLPHDVMGHIPHTITREEARAKIDPEFLPADPVEVDPEPARTCLDRLAAARAAAVQAAVEAEITARTTDHWGQPRTEQRLAFCTDYMYSEARGMAVFEVAPDATDRSDPRVHRAEITGLRHPNAVFIARSRMDLARALSALEQVLAITDEAEHGATRWADPLPVPPWVGKVRAAIAGELGQ